MATVQQCRIERTIYRSHTVRLDRQRVVLAHRHIELVADLCSPFNHFSLSAQIYISSFCGTKSSLNQWSSVVAESGGGGGGGGTAAWRPANKESYFGSFVLITNESPSLWAMLICWLDIDKTWRAVRLPEIEYKFYWRGMFDLFDR